MELGFVSARQRAFEHLSRFFTIHRKVVSTDNSLEDETWSVEIEIDRPGQVLCVEMIVQLDPEFPLSLPYIYIKKELVAELGFPPNVGTTGLVCTFDRNTSIPNPEEPGMVAEACIRKAKSIIENGLFGENHSKYETEFIAYWENKYQDESSVDTRILSLVDETGELPEWVNLVMLDKPIGIFHALLYSDLNQFHAVKRYLDQNKITFREIRTFYLGQLMNLYPPFNMRNEDVTKLLESIDLVDEFKKYLDSRPLLPYVTFAKTIDGRNLVFGWCHNPIEYETRNRAKKKERVEKKLPPRKYDRLLASQNRPILVQRFSPQLLTRNRLIQRTAADYSKFELGRELKVLVVGLGSIGSNLIPLLELANITEFRLVDNDVLSIENIERHLLGVKDVGKSKAEAVGDYLQEKNPLAVVDIRKARIIPTILREPEFLSICDYYFFCTGDVTSETWIANHLCLNNWDRPAFFLWVEPYLAGGHCVYLNGANKETWQALFDDHKFVYNVISNEMHDTVSFVKQEAGCQTTYLPYSASSLKMFLAMLFPKILEIFKKGGESRCFSWIGDISVLQAMGIKLSRHVEKAASFSMVERPIC